MSASRATRPLFRAALSSRPTNGHVAFIPQIRKVVLEFCDSWASSANTRTYIHNQLETVARANPHVEFVVKQRTHKEPIARGYYCEQPCHITIASIPNVSLTQ